MLCWKTHYSGVRSVGPKSPPGIRKRRARGASPGCYNPIVGITFHGYLSPRLYEQGSPSSIARRGSRSFCRKRCRPPFG